MRRFTDRDVKRPHRVSVMCRGIEVGFFNIPQTDPRFVKGDDLIQMALERALTTPARRYEDDVLQQDWDELCVYWAFSWYRINRFGQRIYDAA